MSFFAHLSEAIDQFNALNHEESGIAGVSDVDVTPVSSQAVSEAVLIASDGLYRSGKMHALWTDIGFETLRCAQSDIILLGSTVFNGKTKYHRREFHELARNL